MTAAAGDGVRLCGPLAFFGLVTLLSSGALTDAETIIFQRHVQMFNSQKCTYGPTFWCKNITNAASCHAVKHCIQKTWVTQTYPEDNDEICTICKNMVKEARDTHISNVTLDDLKEIFDGSCELLPLKIVKNECKKLSDEILPELVDTLASQMDPNVVCTVSCLCNNAYIDKLLFENKEKEQLAVDSDKLTCEFCENLVNLLKDILGTNTAEEQFLDVLKGLCKQTGSFSTECLAIVGENYSRIHNTFLVNILKGNVCTIVGICPDSLNSRYNLNYIIAAAKIEEDSLFTAKKEQNEHKPTFVVVDEQSTKVKNINVVKKSPVIVNDVSMPTDKTTCLLCQSILYFVQKEITNSKSDTEIRTVLKKVCFVVPSSFEQQCKQFVDLYGNAFISFIAQQIDPSIICPAFKLCPVTDLFLTSNKDSESSNNCPMCNIFMSALESEISNKDTEEVIRKKMKKLCTKQPSKWKGECTEFVSTQFQSILDMLVAQVKPEEICVLLDICKLKTISDGDENDLKTNMIAITAGQVTIMFPGYNMGQLLGNNYKTWEEPKGQKPFCLVCIVVMTYLNDEIKNKSKQEEIEHVLELICSILPNVVKNECQSFIDSYYQKIVTLVEVGTDPYVACMTLMVCLHDKRGKQIIDLPKKSVHLTATEPTELDSSNSCAACEAFVTVFEDHLTNDLVSVDDIDLIELCNEVKIAHKDQCMEMIESYAQSFKNLLYHLPTWMMCEKLAMCSKNKSVAVNRFSNSKCLEGSELWCKSWDNAKECKTELLCKRSSWNVKIIGD